MDDYQYSLLYYRDPSEEVTTENYEEKNARVYLFSDRSIYRPGQLVYYKGIGITRDSLTHKPRIMRSKDSIEVDLLDANGQTIDSMYLSFNEFGSFHGQFRLPQNVLNGEFSINVPYYANSQLAFSVEEYKRPKFQVELENLKGSYRVNDTVTVIGFARAYAGNNLDGAAVKYRVSRRARFVYPWLYGRWGMPRTSTMEITNGKTITDSVGKFQIQFPAIPDLSVAQQLDPVFDYTVEADVTDINGETRSASALVPVGYISLVLQLRLPQKGILAIDSFRNIAVSGKNLAGESEPAKVELHVYPLKVPQRVIRKRYWTNPDQFVYSEAEFLKYFPHDEYRNESNYLDWKKANPIFNDTLSTSRAAGFNIPRAAFRQGWYMAEAIAHDRYGKEVKAVEYFQLYDPKDPGTPSPTYSWNAAIQSEVQPGEKARFLTGTGAENLFMILQTEKAQDQTEAPGKYEFTTLNHEKKYFEYPVTEEERGGFGIWQFFVKDNRFYSNRWEVSVPWSNKELSISFETVRDKLEPGSQEEWKLRISGNKGEKLAAELLAGMYDASLDQFKPHAWEKPGIWNDFAGRYHWSAQNSFASVQSNQKWWPESNTKYFQKNYDQLNTFWNNVVVAGYGRRNMAAAKPNNGGIIYGDIAADTATQLMEKFELEGKAAGLQIENVSEPVPSESQSEPSNISIRKNFNETAFFFPDLKTDADGAIEFSFRMPEALTQWKLMALAHTKDLALGYATKSVITQKKLMVQPNPPRFLREGDKLDFSAKIVNLSDTEMVGKALLQLIDATTNQAVDGWFQNLFPVQYFTIGAGQSTVTNFPITIPFNYDKPLQYRIVAESGNYSDGEENILPVLTNRMLITESLSLPMNGESARDFRFEKLIQTGSDSASQSLSNRSLTVEFTTNPAWYAIQALPFLMEFPYECAEQTFNRYYANALATTIANSSPRIKTIFEKWKELDSSALLSNLEKNEDLKSVLLEETPWVLEARNETARKKNLALLFDLMRMSRELTGSLDKLREMQTPNGGFSWFKGGPDDRYITQYILTGIGHLRQLKAVSGEQVRAWDGVTGKALQYLDKRIREEYDALRKQKSDLRKNQLSYNAIQYLYMRNFFKDQKLATGTEGAYNFYRSQSQKFWLQQSSYMQGMIALALFRSGDMKTPKSILASLKENALHNEELGMYWKENRGGYYWYQAPTEIQSLLIEAFGEIAKDMKSLNEMKTWLLKQKQTQNWASTKATADACYALLLGGSNWLQKEPSVTISLGERTFKSDSGSEAGTGYFHETIPGVEVKPAMGNIHVTLGSQANPSIGESSGPPAWGAVYWQYFEDLDKITPSATPLQLSKKIFLERNSDRGPVLEMVNDGDELKPGDKLKVRIELRADRDMEYVHMKDMRAAGTEPVNVLSGYRWQGGLGYYETTRDASTNFFFNWLPKGTYVFEYPLFVSNAGNFSVGVATIQCMYAPEFSSHSEGIRIRVTH